MSGDRHSKMAVDGKPKKGGAGIGGWGKGGADDLNEIKERVDDPNYNSEEEAPEMPGLNSRQARKQLIMDILTEYFGSGNIQECIAMVLEAKLGNHASFIRHTMIVAMEKQPYERELVSQLFAALRLSIAPEDQFCEAFQIILNKLEEIVIDIPQAVDMTSKFMARAVIDEVVPPSFVKTCDLADLHAEECVTLTKSIINQKHRTHRVAHIWGPADLASIKRLKEEFRSILEEYINTKDRFEAERCLNKLSLPHSHVHFVIQGIRMGIVDRAKQQSLADLFSYLNQSGVIGTSQAQRGFAYVEESLEDTKLDAPNAPADLKQFQVLAQQQGWLIMV